MLDVLLYSLLIIAARVADVSIGTIRTIVVVQGRRGLAFILAFFEVAIWVAVVSGVIGQVREQPLYVVAYALGFALGNYIGMTIEQQIALGRQVVRIMTRRGMELAQAFRDQGLRVTQFDGLGRDGPVQELFIELGRREVRRVVAEARTLDPLCYYIIDDIRTASSAREPLGEDSGLRGVLKRK